VDRARPQQEALVWAKERGASRGGACEGGVCPASRGDADWGGAAGSVPRAGDTTVVLSDGLTPYQEHY
jgi:hypothetical protein